MNNKKNGLPGDMDHLRLKDHLNASFDIDNLKVSEDLIARTLKAINESGSQEELPKESNKIKRFPVRRLVSAAAVVLVLFVGINVLQNGMGSRKEAQSNLDAGTASDSAAETGTLEYSVAGESPEASNDSAKSNAVYDTASADTAASEGETSASEESTTKFSTDIAKDANKTDGIENGAAFGAGQLSILYPIKSDSVEAFSISKNDGSKMTLTNAGNKVSELYTLLDGYTLTASDTKDYRKETDWIYEAEITTTENQTYTIFFSDTIQVLQTNEETKSSPLAYSVDDMDNLIKQVDEFYNSLK